MSIKNYSRRKFLGNIAAGSTAAALSSLPGGQAARADTDAVTPPYPVTLATHPGPLYSPTSSPPLENIKIVSTDYIPQADVEKIQSYSPTLKLVQCRSHEQFHREVVDAHVIFGVFRPEDFQVAKQLRWIQWRPAGCFYPCQNQEFVESPVVLTNNKRTYAVGISETAIGLLLALAHGLNKYAVQTEKHIWRSLSEPYLRALREYTSGNRNQPFTMVDELREINGITMGLVGFGGIGTAIAYRAHYGFGMRILAVDPQPLPIPTGIFEGKPTFVEELRELDFLPEMARRVDVLVCAAPHTKVNEKMLNESIFRAMKPTAYFINMSRGPIVDTPALVRALKEGWIYAAGLDVTDPEPLPPDHPLWTAGNVLITSHTSGRNRGTERRGRDLFIENVRRYINGLPLLNVVDKERGY
jgi:phosphoglycerate dehydrogenase-like enzyme